MAKHSAVLACSVDGGQIGPWPRVFAAALRSPKGQLTLAVVNDAPHEFDVTFDLRAQAEAVHLFGDAPADEILAYAKKMKADLIVMASHGRKGFEALLLGSETQKVLARTTVPVLVVR